MSKAERGSTSPSSPSTSKLPKFLHKQARDRSRSVVESGSSSTIASSSSSPVSESSKTSNPKTPGRSGKKLFGSKDEKRRQSQDIAQGPVHGPPTPPPAASPEGDSEPPVIVEPVTIPRPRTRSERPLSDNYNSPIPAFYPSSSSNTRITDFPSRLSGWFQHTFSSSSTDLTLPNILSQQQYPSSSSPSKGKGAAALLTAAKHGSNHLSKAMRYILDSDATPDKCTDPIWLLGIEHPGYEPPSPTPPNRRTSVDSRRPARGGSPAPSISPDTSLSQSHPAPSKDHPSKHWPPVFYADFTSRIWLTYRSQFLPIRDTTLEELDAAAECAANGSDSVSCSPPTSKKWGWLGGEKTWSSDTGWGCMLRTGQSLLANALIHLHLGREWRKPPHPIYTADYATYVQILTWFLDDPSPLCPFSVHRMALVGKELGVRVGQWFGPSTAAGAIKKLVHAFPEAQLGVYVASDGGTIYESEVFAASHSGVASPRRGSRKSWGDRAVLILIGHRLGIDGVNPIYYDTLKNLYTWPQSVGIAGGRPSSSYYFVGSQADNLFYLDPHHARPAIPLRPPPDTNQPPTQNRSRQTSPDPPGTSHQQHQYQPQQPHTPHRHVRSPTSPSSLRSSTSTSSASAFSHRGGPASPSPLQHQLSTSSASSGEHSSSSSNPYPHQYPQQHNPTQHLRWQSTPDGPSLSMDSLTDPSIVFADQGNLEDLDPLQRHYCTAYSQAELKTFHCERVRKMHLSGLDPSMLMGFLCRDEREWMEFKGRVAELNRRTKATVLSVQDEPPNWTSDSEMDLRSMSDHDIDIDLPDEDDELPDRDEDDLDEEEDADELRRRDREDDDELSSASGRASVSSPGTSVSARASGVDTEEDPVDPITPGATTAKSSFDFDSVHASTGGKEAKAKGKPGRIGGTGIGGRDDRGGGGIERSISVGSVGESTSLSFDDEEDEDWLDPTVPDDDDPLQTPIPEWHNPPSSHSSTGPTTRESRIRAPALVQSSISTDSAVSQESTSSNRAVESSGGGGKKEKSSKERRERERKASKKSASSGRTVTSPSHSQSASSHSHSQSPSSHSTHRSSRTRSQHTSSHSHRSSYHPSDQQQQQQYPFPATHPEEDVEPDAEGEGESGGEGVRNSASNGSRSGNGDRRIPKMRTAVARDGGRTQSGGVRGLVQDDGGGDDS